MRIVLAGTFIIFFGTWSCKTSGPDSESGLNDATTDHAALIASVKSALKEGSCLGCHADTGESDWKQWALNTKNTFERLNSQEADTDFDPTAFVTKGVYLAYPEYFKKFFTDATKYDDFADNLRPDPGMRVKGSGEPQRNRFIKIRDAMLLLAADTASNESLGCKTEISQDLKDHIKASESTGWSARLLTGNGRVFEGFGCDTGTVNPMKCFADTSTFPEQASLVGDNATSGHRIVRVANVGSTYYWTRSSPDGRYVGNGSTNSGKAHIDDLKNKIRYNLAKKRYDPGFFPDNLGFTFHGNPAVFCALDALDPSKAEGPAEAITVGGEAWQAYTIDTDNKTAGKAGVHCHVDGNDQIDTGGVGAQRISTYQSVGSAQGSKAYVVTGSHSTDIGTIRADSATFAGEMLVYEMKKTTDGYQRVSDKPAKFNLPNEGDYSLTPSTQYVVGRVAGKTADGKPGQLGYRLRSLKNMLEQGANYKAETDTTMSSVCLAGSGSKPMVSLDERFITFHQYEDQNSNLFLVDLLQGGKTYKITNIPAGKRALFAHFRADGWIYFLLADGTSGSDKDALIMASDLAIRIADEN